MGRVLGGKIEEMRVGREVRREKGGKVRREGEKERNATPRIPRDRSGKHQGSTKDALSGPGGEP